MNPPIYPQIRHRAANSRNASVLVFEILTNWVTLRCVERDPRFSTRAAPYFRTPSPSGRLLIPSLKSPAIYFGKPLLQRAFAGMCLSLFRVLNLAPILSGTASDHQIEHTGIGRCVNRSLCFWLPCQRLWQAAVRHSRNKASWAQGRELRRRLCWTVLRSPARLSALRATWSTAKPTRANVTDAPRLCDIAAPDPVAASSRDDAVAVAVLHCANSSAEKTDTRGTADDTSPYTGSGRCAGRYIDHGRVRAAGSRRLQPGTFEYVGTYRCRTRLLGRPTPVRTWRSSSECLQRAGCRTARMRVRALRISDHQTPRASCSFGFARPISFGGTNSCSTRY